ncbi:PEP-CTERM sorting domain-containing protein [Mariniblastus sp.]|nr:PEP-CTERM sorting domain-containing protein [Mariniblastus sp.]
MSFVACSTLSAQVDFDIVINYSGDAEFQPFFNNAEAVWESILTGRVDGQEGGTTFGTLEIDASIQSIDGPGNQIGAAGVTRFADDGSFIVATNALMRFDSADIDRLAGAGSFQDVILHEMGHALGVGGTSLWQRNGLYALGTGRYRGENAIREYQREFDLDATSVPVQVGLRAGSDDNHWSQDADQTVIDPLSPNFGQSFSDELMTSNLSPNAFISNTTGGQFQDLGFVVDFDAIRATSTSAVPEPSSFAILAGVALLGVIRRRR